MLSGVLRGSSDEDTTVVVEEDFLRGVKISFDKFTDFSPSSPLSTADLFNALPNGAVKNTLGIVGTADVEVSPATSLLASKSCGVSSCTDDSRVLGRLISVI